MKCGHPDVMGNLRWKRIEGKSNGLAAGGVWICKTCHDERDKEYRNTLLGMKTRELLYIRRNAERRLA